MLDSYVVVACIDIDWEATLSKVKNGRPVNCERYRNRQGKPLYAFVGRDNKYINLY